MLRAAISMTALVLSLFAGVASATPIRFTIASDFSDTAIESALGGGATRLGLSGSFEVDSEDLKPASPPFIVANNLDLILELVLSKNAVQTPYSLPFSSLNADLEFNTATTFINGADLVIDGEAVPNGSTLLQFTASDLPEPIDLANGFPNGRRFGEDALDVILFTLFRGSIGVGFAAFDGPISNQPLEVALGEISPNDRIVFATAAAPVTPVPLPGSLALMLGSLGVFAAWRRRYTCRQSVGT